MRRFVLPFVFAITSCSSGSSGTQEPDATIPVPDMGPDAPLGFCALEGVAARSFSTGPYGTSRHEVAEDFSVELIDGTTWTFSEKFLGCESYLFVPDTLPTSDTDATSVWERPEDLAQLIDESPRNVHYFFVSRYTGTPLEQHTTAMAGRIDDLLATMSDETAAHWRERLHVVATRAADIDNWIAGVLTTGIGVGGFAIDRLQTLRGIGSLADVTRYVSGAPGWPWDNNLAYVAHEPRSYNHEATRQERLDAEDATVVTLFDGEVLAGDADVTVDLPSASEMATFDTLEVEVEMNCPDLGSIEFGSCGAWDYLSYLFVDDGAAGFIQVARVITTYHREAHWVVDATPMLAFMLDGGTRTFRWSNSQSTASRLKLLFSNQGKGYKPAEATFLWTGGDFNSAYNTLHPDIAVPIPADAARVELWALITGHGGANNNCAEFCDHQHEFTVSAATYLHDHPAIGNDEGCVAEIENGATPNQWGTWWFGRGGWCPGLQVDPYVVDVTGDVTPGMSANLGYRGLFAGGTPPDNSGRIDMISYLVVYK